MKQQVVTSDKANAHKDIPGNPSTAISSKVRLNDRSNGKPLKVLMGHHRPG